MNWAFDIGYMNGFMGGFLDRYQDYYEQNHNNFGYNVFCRPFFTYMPNIFYRPFSAYRPNFDYTDYWRIQRESDCYNFDYAPYRDDGRYSGNNIFKSSQYESITPGYRKQNTTYPCRKEKDNDVGKSAKTTKPSKTNEKSNIKVTKKGSLNVVSGEIDKSNRIFLGRKIKKESGLYGMRIHPVYKERKMHWGLDLSYDMGEEVHSFTDGKVTYAAKMGGYGYLVEIEDSNGVRHRYAHASKILVKVGQEVKAGELIMKAGSTGVSTGAHVHYETRIKATEDNGLAEVKKPDENGYVPVDPYTYWA